MGYYKNLAGQTFGYLTIKEYAGRESGGKSLWLALCKCGKEITVRGNSLTSGNTKSCGCAHREFMKEAVGSNVGQLTGAKWCAIQFNATARGHQVNITQKQAAELFEEQGGRCALSGVQLILDAPRLQITASLDRIDSARDYEMNNIQWIHKDIQKMKNVFSQSLFLEWVRRINNFAKS
jgi:hypothetical protein